MKDAPKIERDRTYEHALRVATKGNVQLTQHLLASAKKHEALSDSQEAKIDTALKKAWRV